MFCSTLGVGAPVPSPPNDGGGGPAAGTTAGEIAPMLALPLSDVTPPLPLPSSGGESSIISSAEVPGVVSPVVEVGSSVLVAIVVVVVGAEEEEAEEAEEEEEEWM
jgi:hypothetical protein